VQRQPASRADAGAFDCGAEDGADVAVLEPAAARVAEHEVARSLIRRREPALTQQLRDRGREDDLAFAARGLERPVDAVRWNYE